MSQLKLSTSTTPEPPGDSRASASCTWHLVSQKDDLGTARKYEISGFPFTIGRRSKARLSLSCQRVSSLHCRIEKNGHELWVEDMASRNGTFVNGCRISERTKLADGDLLHIATEMFRLVKQVEESHGHTVYASGECDQALSVLQFERLMDGSALVPYFQPIVYLGTQPPQVIGYELLSRSRLFGLQNPESMFRTAALLNQEVALSRMCRAVGLRVSKALPAQPHLFLNTHPAELADPVGLCNSLGTLREEYPDIAITLEIHEAAVADAAVIFLLKQMLCKLQIRLAYDDFGAGEARLVDLIEVPPDYLKFDRRLLQGIHAAPAERQQMVGTLVQMVRNLGIAALAEGIEHPDENDVCRRLGFDYSQGFFHGRPAPVKQICEPAAEPHDFISCR